MLLAALELSGATGETFHLSDLTLAAWGIDRRRFGLFGYESLHPDANRVKCELFHKRAGRAAVPLSAYVERVGPNVYRLTPAGRAKACRLPVAGKAVPA